jgi:hypothetical protein
LRADWINRMLKALFQNDLVWHQEYSVLIERNVPQKLRTD